MTGDNYMKHYTVKATTELYSTHLRHCLRTVLRTDTYDDFFSQVLSDIGELKYIMKDIQESKINPVKANTFLTYIDPRQNVDIEIVQSIYYILILSNRKYKNYRKVVESNAEKYLNIKNKQFRKPYKVKLKYAQNEISENDCFEYLLHYAFGDSINLSSEMPCVELHSTDVATQLSFNVLNRVLLRENYYPLGFSEFIQMYDYLDSLTDLYIYTNFTNEDTEILKKERFDRIPMSLIHISDFEKNVIDKGFVKSVRKSLENVSYVDATRLQSLIHNIKLATIGSFEDTCRLFTYTYKLSTDELTQLSRAFSFNPMTFTYLALLKHKHLDSKNGAQITMSLPNCLELLKQSAISQFSMTEHLITIYETDVLIKQLCAQVCDSSTLNIKEISATYADDLAKKEQQISELIKDVTESRSKIANYSTKEISQKDLIDNLKKDINTLHSQVLKLEDERDFYKAIVDSDIDYSQNDSSEDSSIVLECLEDVLLDYPDLQISIVTRNNLLTNTYAHLSNIKIVNAWSLQFDTRPIKESQIVIVDTSQLEHAITYRVKSALSSRTKLFFTKNSNTNILNNYIISLVKTHGISTETTIKSETVTN